MGKLSLVLLFGLYFYQPGEFTISGMWLVGDPSWVVGSTGKPSVHLGVIHNAAKALDGDNLTHWNPLTDTDNWYIVLDLKTPQTLTRIALNNFGDTVHDIAAFKLLKAPNGDPYNFEVVVTVINVQVGTDGRQEFGGFQGTARYWRFVVTRTDSGFQPWLRELKLYGTSDFTPNSVPTSPGMWLTGDPSWVVGSTGTPWVHNGVTHDAAKILDGDNVTHWNPHVSNNWNNHVSNNWCIVLDLKTPQTLARIALNNFGDTIHDIEAFKLLKAPFVDPYNWEDVVNVTTVQVGTDQRQEFGGFQGTARYWRFVVTRTDSGFQPWLRELKLYAISDISESDKGKYDPCVVKYVFSIKKAQYLPLFL